MTPFVNWEFNEFPYFHKKEKLKRNEKANMHNARQTADRITLT